MTDAEIKRFVEARLAELEQKIRAVIKGGTSEFYKNNTAGRSNPMAASGDMIIGGFAGAMARLVKGEDGSMLTMINGLPSWAVNDDPYYKFPERCNSGFCYKVTDEDDNYFYEAFALINSSILDKVWCIRRIEKSSGSIQWAQKTNDCVFRGDNLIEAFNMLYVNQEEGAFVYIGYN